jgi:hypothetical protein
MNLQAPDAVRRSGPDREPFGRPGVVAAARLANALFFLAGSAYGLLSCSPFAYRQFIEPKVVPALNDFVAVSPWLFWAMYLLTLLTLLPLIRGGAARRLALAYLVVWGGIGVAVAIAPPLATIGSSWRALAVGLLALASPVSLAIVDHAAWRIPELGTIDARRALVGCLCTAAAVWAVYAAAAPLRLAHAGGLTLPTPTLGAALAASLVFHLFVFMAIFLAIASAVALASFAERPAHVSYWLLVALLALAVGIVIYALVCASIALASWTGVLASSAIGLTAAAVWADLALLRGQPPSPRTLDSLDLFSAPVGGGGARAVPAAFMIAMPFIAYLLVEAVSRFDWNFLIQKLGVLIVWLATLAAVYALTSSAGRRSHAATALVPLVVLGLYHAAIQATPASVIDRYAVLDPSFRLIRDAGTGRSAETVEYYGYLGSHTLISDPRIPSIDIDFVKPLPPAAGPVPNIFLFVIDSLRRDYLSAYNDRVTFTPEIGRLAKESFVFDRGFTRYAGTSLAVPSIWAGGMMLHTLTPAEFGRRNTLLKLLDANRYQRLMTMDNIVDEIVPRGANFVQLQKDKEIMQHDVCATVEELEARVTSADRSRPVFFYSLPQNLHIAIASRRPVPAGESYPGFFAPVASSLRQIDTCLGRFVAFLKRTGLDDNSIVIITADHGDSLGEEGRWGHAYFVVPEVMRIPLIVYLPPRMRARVAPELGAVAFSADLTPSLYALLGYDPADLGPLFGRPLFVAPDADVSWRRRQPFLVASSYGAVYGAVRDNGRRLLVVDAVDGRESAFDSTGTLSERLEVTRAMIDENRRFVQQQLDRLASQFQYRAH